MSKYIDFVNFRLFSFTIFFCHIYTSWGTLIEKRTVLDLFWVIPGIFDLEVFFCSFASLLAKCFTYIHTDRQTDSIVWNPPPPTLVWGRGRGGGWASYQIFKKGGAWQVPNFKRGLAGKEEVTFFRGLGCSFYMKNKLKSEIFNDKKSL